MGWITGNRGSELRRIEQESATYLFVALDKHGDERLLIFGCKAGSRIDPIGRMLAERMVRRLGSVGYARAWTIWSSVACVCGLLAA